MSSEVTVNHATEAAIMAASGKAAYTGGGVAAVGGWALSNEMIGLMGVLIGLIGLFVNWYYKHKLTMIEIRLKEEEAVRDREAHAARMGMYS